MSKEFIVAIELGSSEVRGIAGRKNADNSYQILALATEKANQCIRKGAVYNVDKTVQVISKVVSRLEQALGTKIACVFVGIGGQSIRSVKNTKERSFALETKISDEIVDTLRDENGNTSYPEMQLLYPTTQEFKVDNQYQTDPVGIQCHRIEGNFLNILCRKNNYRNLNKCFELAGLEVAEMYLSPVALADSVLTDTEKRTGCALIDFGAETTTVAVYFKNILRHLAVIPLGGENITHDLESYPMERDEAEKLKLKYAKAFTPNEELNVSLSYSINTQREISAKKFVEIVEARQTEIITNAIMQIPREYADKLTSGIVVTGGASMMNNMQQAIQQVSPRNKIRLARFVQQTINSNKTQITEHNGMMNTLLGLLAKGDRNCAGQDLAATLFPEERKVEQPLATNTTQPNAGAVIPENRLTQEQPKTANEKKTEEAELPKEPSKMKKATSSIKNFFKRMMEEEE